MPGHYEQEAIKAAASALELSPDPADRCRAQFALGKAHLVLYHLHRGPAAGSDAWPEPGGLQTDAAVTALTTNASPDVSKVGRCLCISCTLSSQLTKQSCTHRAFVLQDEHINEAF